MPIPPALTNFPAWHEGDGPAPYVFSGLQPGSRCGWSCKWATGSGIVKPGDWFAVENMTREQLLAELADVLALTPSAEGSQLYQLQEVVQTPVKPVADFLRQAREHYPEFTYAGNPPEKVLRNIQRPDWEKAQPKMSINIFEKESI